MIKQRKQILLISDVFGRTCALEELAGELPGRVGICDPYAGVKRGFESESEAYTCFTAEVGLTAYTNHLKNTVNSASSEWLLIGFSVGASAVWHLGRNREITNVAHAVGFYGSQIRHSVEHSPQFPVRLVWPHAEQHFSVDAVMAQLNGRNNVCLNKSPFLHGFMNKASKNYDQDGYDEYLQILCQIAK